ncbi:hypothetical protein [Microvirga lotononidis]|uniref:Uncharacterized protein n=1 Tax=Microvirga lotononidis TaxID=864069 RepID=I4YVL4_9HYPH|nr:hypothetical protein [Microvirga lotononidis]EIM28006.1 hypothetical protein MicloDRAFT_00045830 [Microvirga lotononidis]WQO29941.1 hypothetical protein U0023_01850 [Microvirga lotononidis]
MRLLTTDLEAFAQEDNAVLQAGLVSSPYLTDDDANARHARRPEVTTQIGGERFCVFRTSRSKSRLNFLSLLRGGCEDYVVNVATQSGPELDCRSDESAASASQQPTG